MRCPKCEEPLQPVEYPADSPLNLGQWESQRAGDWYCTKCHGERGKSGHRYYWNREVQGHYVAKGNAAVMVASSGKYRYGMILDCWGPQVEQDVEEDGIFLDDVLGEVPKQLDEDGLWIFEGLMTVEQDGDFDGETFDSVVWEGKWRRPNLREAVDLLLGRPIWNKTGWEDPPDDAFEWVDEK